MPKRKQMKTNKEKNQAHDSRMQERVRPKQPEFNYAPLEAVLRQWATSNK